MDEAYVDVGSCLCHVRREGPYMTIVQVGRISKDRFPYMKVQGYKPMPQYEWEVYYTAYSQVSGIIARGSAFSVDTAFRAGWQCIVSHNRSMLGYDKSEAAT